ncbi:sigma-70 family RNA polymerase sigma factor [Roseicella sp. DB1501]|uniref:sigma-70 family RNA polymerase sigma factor n=1 Tax=Roseicella sp. DB1501 TaxID=2730925 RepID=UPI0020C420D6|nr:sigma-70 family RNA polymerase sigma factor [Roseicella sp. DB1501]
MPQPPMPIPLAQSPDAAEALLRRADLLAALPRAAAPPVRPTGLMPREAAEDDTLMAWAAAGDRAAFGVLVARHGERALRIALRVLGNAEEAEEVAQEAFLRAWQAAASFDPARARFTTWLHRITLNLAIDRSRRRGKAVNADEEALARLADPAPGPEAAAVAAEDRAALADALARLPARQRAAIALAYEEGLSGAEAAALLDVSERALEGLLRRARLMLRRLMTS